MSVTPLDRLREAADGRGAIAPVHVTFGTLLDEIEPGHAVARVPRLPPHRLRGPGPVPVLADLVLSAAVTSCLPAGRRIATLTLHLAGLGPLPEAGAALVATARLVALGGDVAVSSAELCAPDGRPVASCSGRSVILPADGDPGSWSGEPEADPFAGFAAAPLAAASLANSAGGVQGGVLAALLGHALAGGGPAYDLDVTFLRAVPADGRAITVVAEQVHAGRRFGAGRAEVRDAAGRCAVIGAAASWTQIPI